MGLKKHWEIAALFIFSLLLFFLAIIYKDLFDKIMSVATFLTWHSLFEFISIFAAFSIFIVTYYTYEESKNIRMIIFASAFLFMGILDVFHALSYKGMADFFVPNTSADRATTFWVLSRLIGNIGLLIGVSFPKDKISKINKSLFIIPVLILAISIFISATYYPGFIPPMFIEGYGLTNFKIFLELMVILIMIIILIKVIEEYKSTNLKKEYLFSMGILLSIFSELAFIGYASVYDAYNYLGHFYKLIAFFILFKSIYTENVKMPYHEIKKAKNALLRQSEKLDQLVKERTKDLEEINRKLLMDLEYAREMQCSFLPSIMPTDIALSFYSFYLPAERLSGDFYNIIELDKNNIAIYIGDVAGHGVSAAMLTVFAHQNMKHLTESKSMKIISPPNHIMKNIYKSFNETRFNEETYIVMLYGIYNIKNRRFTYSSAGINVPPLIVKKTGEIMELDTQGHAIYKLGKFFSPIFENKVVQLEQGDKMLFYTDGLVDTKTKAGDRYRNYLYKTIKENYFLKASDFSDTIIKDFYAHIGDEKKLKDDVTFLLMEIH